MNRNNHTSPVLLGLVVAVLLAICWTIIALGNKEKQPEVDEFLAPGLAFLEAQEQKNPAAVLETRQKIYQAKIDAQRDKIIAQLNSGAMDPFSMFQDYLILGDSRAVGFWYMKFLDKDRVLADGGHTIRNLAEYVDTVVERKPSQIFLCYGLNDTSIGYWNTAEEYVTEYMQTVNKIRERLPDATIVVSSILPAKDPAFQRSEKWRNIPQWSAALEEACKENDILFANCDDLANTHPNLWDPVDGIHFRKEFYPYWASCLIATILMEGAA